MKRAGQLLLYFILIFFQPLHLAAQIVINEFLASNTGSIIDPDFNESADWLELYNAGSTLVNIGGYFISDNFDTPQKWQIPAGTEIAPNGFLLIWADGLNTGLHTNFKISADGEELAVYSAAGVLVDSISFGLQEPNISLGRSRMENAWVFFTEPTPGAANDAQTFNGIVQNVPRFSVLGGIFQAPVTLEITNPFGGQIHFTRDGSEPDENSPVINASLTIDKTTVVRARIYQPGKVPGKIVTHTYFIDSNNETGTLPVVSIATNPDNFWDPMKGIYVQDFKPEWEIPVNIELFENDGSDRAGFNLAAGIKVNGLYSWQLPQKMLGVYFRKEYGEGHLDYPLLFDRSRSSYDNFALRASGSDWAYTLFRDGMTQSLTAENMDVDFQGFRACVVFVNGEYLGIHNIRSKIDEDFIVQNHHLVDQKVDMIENENYVEAGSLDEYAAFEALYHKDLSVQENFDAVAAKMDIENFTDFIITEIYSQNTSVDHNIMAWKPQNEGKWKWILNDLDRGFFNAGNNMIEFYADRDVIPLSQLLTNENYRNYFGKRMADHLFTTFDPELVKLVIDEFKSSIENEIPKHIQRWQGTSSDYGDPIPSADYWNNEVEKMRIFAEQRPSALLNDLKNYGFEQSEPLSISVYPENAGTVNFNGIEIKRASSHGAYPVNEEISLIAQAKSGNRFLGWKSEETTIIVGSEEEWKYDDSGNEPPANWLTSFGLDWSSGKAELGYGDNDESTVLDFGGDSNHKIITTWFRKNFSVENAGIFQELKINLKCDDGAVVYLNGSEVVRENLPQGEIDHFTLALSGISGSSEDDFSTYLIDASLLQDGENSLAVEVHQVSESSSDISFDLNLRGTSAKPYEFISTDAEMSFIHSGEKNLVAVFESDGSCIVPSEIDAELILKKDCSPFYVPENVRIAPAGKLLIEPGVEILLSDDVSIEVNGLLMVNGTVQEPVIFRSNPNSVKKRWGILNFVNSDSSFLKNVVIEDASKGYHPLREVAAISAFHSVVNIDGAIIENNHENPVAGRYSDIRMKNSRLHSEITGDLINIKYGKGIIDSCEFVGNDMPDTDGIDFDDVENGIIRNSLIRDLHGFNSDAVDIGEQAENVQIENLVVYNITDKGVSVGQRSTATISNSIFVNCNLGAGFKRFEPGNHRPLHLLWQWNFGCLFRKK